MPKITANRAKGLINDAIHQMTLGKETHDIQAAMKILESKRLELEAFLFRRNLQSVKKTVTR